MRCDKCGQTVMHDSVLQYGLCRFCFVCSKCGDGLDINHYEHNGDLYCEDCFHEYYDSCGICGEIVSAEKTLEHNRKFYCEDCFNEYYDSCGICGEIVSVEETLERNGELYCEDCFHENFTRCCVCYEYVSNNNIFWSEITDANYCESCYSDEFTTCEGCGCECRHEATDEDGYCCDCSGSADSYGIYSYGYKPKPEFYGKSDLYFGIELETECWAGEMSEAETLLDFVYAKYDSSIDGEGFEIVSHPCSWAWLQEHKNKWESILSLRNRGYRSYNTDSCGMHVHMSKKAFTGLHLYKFLKLFFENPNFILKISRRKEHNLNKYASLEQDESLVYKAKTKNSKKRYTAVNLRNDETVEIRIFRGTLHPTGFWMNVEFCKAAYDYTKNESQRDITGPGFCLYVKNNQKGYSDLYKFMVEKKLCV